MSRRGNYNGGGSVKNTMTYGKKAYLEKRIQNRVKRKRDEKEYYANVLEEWKSNPPPDVLIKRKEDD
jgi:exopolysaccharide biosynthesis predicted pyruvyltransferase EpsI